MNRLALSGLLVLACLMAVRTAHANCASPTGVAGQIIYNHDHHVPQYCNGTKWLAFTVPVPGGGAGCTSPTGEEGRIIYNTDFGAMQYCNGTSWIGFGAAAPSGGGGSVNSANLLAWYKLDDGSGTTATDAASPPHNGALTNGPTWTAGKVGAPSRLMAPTTTSTSPTSQPST